MGNDWRKLAAYRIDFVFIPSVVAVIQYQDILQKIGIDLFFIILIGTITVMISSGLTAELMMHHKVKNY